MTLYNSVCIGKSLTVTAEATCGKLLTFINDIKVRYANCGYDCYTIAGDDGRWGWQYLDLVPETRQVSNGDATEEITRTAFCFVKLGAVSIGECEE